MKMKTRGGLAFVALMLPLAAAVYAAEYNFYEQAEKKGCSSSITERGQRDCAEVQKAKDDACAVPLNCEPDKQEKAIAEYNETKEQLDSGKANDSDKDKLKETVCVFKDHLDRPKAAAREGTSVAERCVRACARVKTFRSGSWRAGSG